MRLTKLVKSYFLRGLAVLLPTIVTIWIFIWGFWFIRDNISIHVCRALVRLFEVEPFFYDGWSREALERVWIETRLGSLVGFILSLIGVILVGFFLASVVGKALWRKVEKLILNIPFLKQVYPYVKQITDFLLMQHKQEKLFSRVVAVEYPRKGIWSMGLVTGTGLQRVCEKESKAFYSVLIPTSPTPFTGFVIMVPQDEAIELDLPVEEAIRYIVSGGVIAPSTVHPEEEWISLPEKEGQTE